MMVAAQAMSRTKDPLHSRANWGCLEVKMKISACNAVNCLIIEHVLLLRRFQGISCPPLASWTDCSPVVSRLVQIDQSKQGNDLGPIVGQTAVISLQVTKLALDDAKRMFNLGPDFRLGVFDRFQQFSQRGIRQRTSCARAQSHMPGDNGVLILFPLLRPDITRITMNVGFRAMQQGMGLGDIKGVGRRGDQRMGEAGVGIDPNMPLHPKVPVVALFGLMHLGVPATALVLGGAGRCNQGGIHLGALAKEQAVLGQHGVDFGQELLGNAVFNQAMPKAQDGAFIRNEIIAFVQAGERTHGGNVVQGFLHPGIGQGKPQLHEVDTQNHCRRKGRPPAIGDHRGLDLLHHRQQSRRRHHTIDVSQKLLTLGLLRARGKTVFGNTAFHARRSSFVNSQIIWHMEG